MRRDVSGMATIIRRPAFVGALIASILGLAIIAGGWAGGGDTLDMTNRLAPPTWGHPLGTDHLGRNLAARVAAGADRSVVIMLVVALGSLILGAAAGIPAALSNSASANAVIRLADMAVAAPRLIIGLVVAGLFGLTPLTAALALLLTGWGAYALLFHGLTRALMREPHWHAALALGTHPVTAVWRHGRPEMTAPIRAYAGSDAARVLIVYSSLAFIGLGADTSAPDWGGLIWEYRYFVFEAPWLVLGPIGAITGLAAAAHLICDNGIGFNRASAS
jgi:ABC-type dipeptide/oligopeptide/nickel transport system permease subunit